mmetsp:Transcript_4191/g.15064  ORF Transcript_4191/g.15064 Transcript_4191/m.15064 type:complete len:474 (+) Transcript_4191:206-1627(+)
MEQRMTLVPPVRVFAGPYTGDELQCQLRPQRTDLPGQQRSAPMETSSLPTCPQKGKMLALLREEKTNGHRQEFDRTRKRDKRFHEEHNLVNRFNGTINFIPNPLIAEVLRPASGASLKPDWCFWAPRSRPGCIDTGYTFRVDIGAGDAHVVSPPVPGRAGASYQALLERLPSGRWAAHGTDGNNIGQLSPSLTAGEATGVEFKWESAQSLVWTRDVVGNSQDTCRPLGSKDNEQRPAHGHDQPNGLRDLLDVFPMKDEVDLVDAVLKAESLSLPSVSQPVLKNRGTLYMVGDSTTLQWFGQVKQIHVSREICSAVDMGGKGSTRNMTAMDGFAEMKYVRYRIGGRPRIQEREETAESASKSESESLSTLFEQALHTVSRKEASALARAAQSQTQTWLGSVVNRCVCIMPLPASLRLIGSQAEHACVLWLDTAGPVSLWPNGWPMLSLRRMMLLPLMWACISFVWSTREDTSHY